MSDKPTDKAAAFMAENEKQPVVSGAAFRQGGGIFTLKNGKIFRLSLDDVRSMPMPKWPWDFEGYTE